MPRDFAEGEEERRRKRPPSTHYVERSVGYAQRPAQIDSGFHNSLHSFSTRFRLENSPHGSLRQLIPPHPCRSNPTPRPAPSMVTGGCDREPLQLGQGLVPSQLTTTPLRSGLCYISSSCALPCSIHGRNREIQILGQKTMTSQKKMPTNSSSVEGGQIVHIHFKKVMLQGAEGKSISQLPNK